MARGGISMNESEKKTILIVEDEAIIAMMERNQLESENYQVLHATTGEKAVELVCGRKEPVDLILMDIDLGKGMDGTETARIILRGLDVPILFLSSHTEKEIVSKTEAITNYGYVVKNSSFTVLDASIKMAFKLFEASKRINAERMKNEAAYEEMQVINENLLRAQGDLLRNEADLRKSEERYRYIDESSLDSIYSYDRHGRFTHANRALCKLLGSPYERIIGKTHEQLGFPREKCEEWARLHQRVYDTDSTVVAVTETPIPNSQSVYFEVVLNPIHDATGDIIGISGTTRDITERRKAQQALEESEKNHRLLTDSMSDVIWVFNLGSRRFTYVSPSIINLRGLTVEEALDEPLESTMTKESYERVMGKVEDLLAEFQRESDASAPHHTEIQQPCKNGELIWVEVATRFRHDEKGEIEIVGVSRNIEERKRAETRIREITDKFSKLFEQSPYPVMILDSRDGSFYDVNQAFLQSAEYSREELLGRTAVEFGIIAPEDAIRARDLIAEFGQFSDQEISIRTKSGKHRVGLVNGRIIEINDHAYLVQTVVDITERKQEQKSLKESEERFRLSMLASRDGIWDWNIPENSVYYSPGWSSILGETKVPPVFSTWEGRIHPEDKPNVAAGLKEHLEGRSEHWQKEHRLRMANGDWKWVLGQGLVVARDPRGNPLRMIGTMTDISGQKLAQQSLREKEEKYRFALEGSNLAEWDWDCKTGKVTRNDRWATMLGYSPGEIEETLQRGIELRHPDDDQRVNQAVSDHLAGLTDHYSIEYRMKTKTGDYRWIRDCGKIMVRDEMGNPVRLCGTHEDIDDKKKTRDRIDSLLAEKELLLKEVHHRIKNNMNTISGLLSLQENATAEATAKAALRDAATRIKSMVILYDKLYRSSDYTEMSIRDYLSVLTDEVIANFPNCAMVEVTKDIQDFSLDAKRVQIIGILVNELLTNSMKYAFKGREKGLITVSGSNAHGVVTISIQDDGVGVPGSLDFKNSTGFGLQLVQALTQQLDGRIRIERGSGVKVFLEFTK